MSKELILLGGLPGCGKTRYISDNTNSRFLRHTIVCADDLIDEIPDDHGRRTSLAKAKIKDCIESGISKLLFDSGAINTKYIKGIIDHAKMHGYYVECIFLDVPASVCLDRISRRERKVPTDDIMRKSQKVKAQLHKLEKWVDCLVVESYYQPEYFFFDMDGVVAAYESFEYINGNEIDFYYAENFKYADPVFPVIKRIRKLDQTKVFIYSASPNSITTGDKKKWLSRYLPGISDENQHYVGSSNYKGETFAQLIKHLKLPVEKVLYIEDSPAIIKKCKSIGINCIHVSKFLASY